MATVDIFGIIRLDLEKIVKLSREFLSADRKVKIAIKEFIVQAEEAYGVIVESVTPFYEMQYTDNKLSELFPGRFSNFMTGVLYDKKIRDVSYRCSNVQQALKNLERPKAFMSSKKFEELRTFANESWILRDYTVSDTMAAINKELEANLGRVSILLREGRVNEARNQLQLFLSQTRESFERIKVLLSELDIIKRKIH